MASRKKASRLDRRQAPKGASPSGPLNATDQPQGLLKVSIRQSGHSGRVDNLTWMASGSFASGLGIVLRTLAEVHDAEFHALIRDFNTGRTEHGVTLQTWTDPEKVHALVYAGAYSRTGNKDLLYSVMVLPGDEVATVVGEIELSVADTESLFKVSVTAGEPQQIADEIRRVASEVCNQRHWLASLDAAASASPIPIRRAWVIRPGYFSVAWLVDHR